MFRGEVTDYLYNKILDHNTAVLSTEVALFWFYTIYKRPKTFTPHCTYMYTAWLMLYLMHRWISREKNCICLKDTFGTGLEENATKWSQCCILSLLSKNTSVSHTVAPGDVVHHCSKHGPCSFILKSAPHAPSRCRKHRLSRPTIVYRFAAQNSFSPNATFISVLGLNYSSQLFLNNVF